MSLDLYILQVEQLLTATGFIIINAIILLGSAMDISLLVVIPFISVFFS